MSNTHQFTGLTNIYKKRDSRREFVVGEPCIYKDHYTEAYALRCNKTGACRLCLEEYKAKQSLSFDLGRVRESHHKRAARFFSYIDVTDWNNCWKFEQPSKSGPNRYFWIRPQLVNRYTHHIHRVLTWLTWGDLGNCATKSICGERNCCNPLHQVPIGFGDLPTVLVPKVHLDEQLEIMISQASAYNTYQSSYKQGMKNSELILPSLLNVNFNESNYDFDDSGICILTPFQQAIKATEIQIKSGSHTSQKC